MQFDIRRFDIYRKVPKDLTQPTFAGACISILSCVFMAYLFLAELTDFITPDIQSELFVDDPVGHDERIPVYIDISLPKMQCKYLGLDIQDDLGRHEVGFVENTKKRPIKSNEGCRIKANFKINKVPGNFHISTHSSREQPQSPNMAHIVHEVTFGETVPAGANLPGSFNPLKEKDRSEANAQATHDYFMKVVPTVYEDISAKTIYPYQYTFAYRDYTNKQRSPAIWFRYSLTPITVRYHERRMPVYTFLTAICAIIGGTFTVAGIIDSLFFTATEIFKKVELGKLS